MKFNLYELLDVSCNKKSSCKKDSSSMEKKVKEAKPGLVRKSKEVGLSIIDDIYLAKVKKEVKKYHWSFSLASSLGV